MVEIFHSHDTSLLGASGREHTLTVSRWAGSHADVPAVFALLSYHGGDASHGPTVLHVDESDSLEAALAVHGEYPCMQTFVDAVASLPIESVAERADVRRDLISAQKPPCEGCWPPMPAGPEGTTPFPDRVVGGCLAEFALLDLRIEHAVRQRRVVRFVHRRTHCEVEPHAYGIDSDGHTLLFAYQTSFGAGGGNLDPWKAFRLAEVHGLVITDRPCGGARPGVESPIAVTFAQSDGVALRTAHARVQDDASPQAEMDLRRKVEGAVQQLRTQALELRRIEAECTRLEHRIALSDAPPELALALATVQAAQPHVRRGLLNLIPEVAELQRRLPSL